MSGTARSRQVNELGGGGSGRPCTLCAPAARAQRARLGSEMGLAAAAAPPPTCWRRGAGAWGQQRGSQGEASEVLAFLVMCLIYLLTLGLGSLNPIDFSDHVSSGGQVA